ncbi:hypothetical protein BOMU111920_09895 [Bordetella muralis]|jgi:hypothetical protein
MIEGIRPAVIAGRNVSFSLGNHAGDFRNL